MCLYAWPIGSGMIRRCGVVGVDEAVLEKVCPVGQALKSHMFKLCPV